ncbi:hypothetical protein ALC60_13543, partial [Trachymyrmex zeteki]
VSILNPGHHFLHSISQLSITEVGTIIRCGPQFPFSQARCANNAIVCIVLPRPISLSFIHRDKPIQSYVLILAKRVFQKKRYFSDNLKIHTV